MEICPRHRIELDESGYCTACVAAVMLQHLVEEVPFAMLGGYELIEELGRGGMGVVYRARQVALNREVALKLLPSGSLAGREFVRRFRREAELAARVRHPHIVPVYEAGEVDGELFYSMELVSGGTLADRGQGRTTPPREAAQLMVKLAAAVAHAHGHDVLHRDLKPANVLVDEQGEPKIADFGLARPFEGAADLTSATRSFGSPAYLAPELMRDPASASPLSDVYSLGAILYFLLCGRSPFVSGTLDELLRQVRDCEPPAPRLLNPGVPKDLQKICLKALEKNPLRRYAGAAELQEDLQRFLEGRPVLARPAGVVARTWRRAKRAPWLTAALVALVLAFTGGVAGVAWQAKIANERAAEARRSAAELRLNLYSSDLVAASLAIQRGDAALAGEMLGRWERVRPEEDPRGFEWRMLRHLALSTARHRLDERAATVTAVAVRDGAVAMADQTGHLAIQGLADGKPRPAPAVAADEVAYLPEGGLVAGDPAGTVRLFDAAGQVLAERPGRQFSVAAAAPRIVVGAVPRFHWWVQGGPVQVFDWQHGKVIREFLGNWRQAVISPDGGTVVLAGAEGGLKRVDLASGATDELPVADAVWALSISPDGRWLAAGNRRVALLWDLQQLGRPPFQLPHGLTVWMTSFSADSRRLVTACSDRRVRIWEVGQPAAPPLTLTGHRSEVWCAVFAGEDAVVSGGKDGEVLRWDLQARPAPGAPLMVHDYRTAPVFSPDGRRLLTHEGGCFRLHDLAGGTATALPPEWNVGGFSMDGRRLLALDPAGRLGQAAVERPADFAPFAGAEKDAAAVHTFFTAGDGRWIVRVLQDGSVLLNDPQTGRLSHRVAGPPPGSRHAVAASRDGHWLAVCGEGEGAVCLHDLQQGKVTRLSPASGYYYVSLAFSPDGSLLAAGDLGGPIGLWRTVDGGLHALLPGHPEETTAVAFSPDGRTLASMGYAEAVKFWHLPTLREVHSITLADAAYGLAFSPDGSRLAVTVGHAANERIDWIEAPWSE